MFDCERAYFSAIVYLFWCILVCKRAGTAFMYLSVYSRSAHRFCHVSSSGLVI